MIGLRPILRVVGYKMRGFVFARVHPLQQPLEMIFELPRLFGRGITLPDPFRLANSSTPPPGGSGQPEHEAMNSISRRSLIVDLHHNALERTLEAESMRR